MLLFCAVAICGSKPILAQPVQAKPIMTRPIIAQPILAQPVRSQPGNRHVYLDEFCDPYYPSNRSGWTLDRSPHPALLTAQWIGDKKVQAVVTLGIDDMRDTARYEAYLRPLLDRLKKIDGRAPVSIMTCSVDPRDPQLQAWLKEGLSIECHTVDHPCPCLNGGDFDKAKSTYDRCVDIMHAIPGNRPVAFRFPCMDSLNTPSPRAYAEILNRTTPAGNFLQASTSVTCLFTPDDPAIAELFRTRDGKPDADRFRRYVPFPSFVNQIRNYPYPYLIGGKCWEFPCTIPDDWQGQNLQKPNNPQTVEDLKAALDATFLKQGIANIIFHPHGWIRAEQMAEVVDYVDRKYNNRVLFLTFQECMKRINENMLLGQPVRHPRTGKDNGVRLLDLNGDGIQDVFIGNEQLKVFRIWDPDQGQWQDCPHEFDARQVRFGLLDGQTVLVHQPRPGKLQLHRLNLLAGKWQPASPIIGVDSKTTPAGIRLRDLNNDGNVELIIATPGEKTYSQLKRQDGWSWVAKQKHPFPVALVDENGSDHGARFVDLDGDGHDDLVVSNDQQEKVFLYDPSAEKFKSIPLETEIPAIVTGGKNGGVWFSAGHLWVQNEHTHRLPDGIDRRSFARILADTSPNPRSPQQSLKSIRVDPRFEVQLMAAEPLVQDPIAIEWGIDGKLWVVEMADYPLGLDDAGKPGGRVRYLEDTDDDGRYDRSTLFVDGIPFPTGVLPTNIDPDRPSCLITAAPFLVQATRSGHWSEIVADPTSILIKGFGEGNQQHRFNGFSPGLDNWIYLANGDSGGTVVTQEGKQKVNINGRDLKFRISSGIEVQPATGQTQFGRHRDRWGNWFGCSNPVPLRQYVLPDELLARNPHYRYPSPRVDIATAANTRIHPISRVLSHWSGYRPPGPGEPHRFTSACSTNFYRDSLFPAEFSSCSYTCEPVHNLVHRRVIKRDGLIFTSRRPESERDREFLASTDSWFRPTMVTTGPDGAIWITDMYRLVIEHPEWIDDQREKDLFLRAGHDRGRIYRVIPRGVKLRPLPQRSQVAGYHHGSAPDSRLQDLLLEMLGSENRWSTETAQRFLVHLATGTRGTLLPDSLMVRLKKLLSSDNPLVRLHAACTLDGCGGLDDQSLLELFKDQHPDLRRHAARMVAARLAGNPGKKFLQGLGRLVRDPDPAVVLQVAFSLGQSNAPQSAEWLAEIGSRNFSNPYIRAAVFSSLNKENLEPVLHASATNLSNGFRLELLEQACRFERGSLAISPLIDLLQAPGVNKLSTTELESTARIIQSLSVSTVQKLTPDQVRSLKHLTEESASQNLQAVEVTPRRAKAAFELVAGSPFFTGQEKVDYLAKFITPRVPPEIQIGAVQGLQKVPSPAVADVLVSRWRSVSPAVQQHFFQTIVQRPQWTAVLLQAVQRGRIGKSEFSSAQRARLLAQRAPEAARLAKGLFENADSAGLPEQVQTVANYVQQNARSADRSVGEALFRKHCSTCHQLGGIGNRVGPDLATLKDRSPHALVRAILQPNEAVEDKYKSYLVALEDGRELVGIIQQESSTQIRLVPSDGKPVDLLRKEIEQIRSTGKSLMPDNLGAELDRQKLVHLTGFILAQLARTADNEPPKKFAGNRPAVVKSSDDRTLLLTAKNCEIHGPSLVYESKYGNLGFWGSAGDHARWTLITPKAGKYRLTLEYACPPDVAGNRLQFEVAGRKQTVRVDSTGSWDEYRTARIGVIDLPAGKVTAVLSAKDPLNGFLMDFRSLKLELQQ